MQNKIQAVLKQHGLNYSALGALIGRTSAMVGYYAREQAEIPTVVDLALDGLANPTPELQARIDEARNAHPRSRGRPSTAPPCEVCGQTRMLIGRHGDKEWRRCGCPPSPALLKKL